jgi:thiosulfate/3-mercaptopyruvate sulfurtransferase
MYTTLVSVEELKALQSSGAALMVFDCSFDLMNPAAGEEQYHKGHIPGAVYAHLDNALSDKGTVDADGTHHPHPDAASGGRHPLPSREKFAMWLSSVGFANDMQAVVYDRNGSLYCGRLWWMLKWMGHDAVAVLDGGLQAWQASGGAVTDREEPSHFQSNFAIGEPLRALATTDKVLAGLGNEKQTLIDARAAPRYKGEVEPLDPVAGHIPGALNTPFAELAPSGRFLSPGELDGRLAAAGERELVAYCGSGITACTVVLAAALTGRSARLYPGSWSEWCSLSLPVEPPPGE